MKKESAPYGLVSKENYVMDSYLYVSINVGKIHIPYGYCGVIFPCSYMTDRGILLYGGSHIIDSDCNEDVIVRLVRCATHDFSWNLFVNKGDRIANLVLIACGDLPDQELFSHKIEEILK